MARHRVASFSGFHMTPLKWLHITVLTGGPADHVPAGGLQQMVDTASELLSDSEPTSVTIGKLLVPPRGHHARRRAGRCPSADPRRGTDCGKHHDGYGGMDDSPWKPHITLCYSTACQPAEPVMAALGPALPAREIRIDTVSLVIQHGPERLWDWRIAGTVHFAAYMAER